MPELKDVSTLQLLLENLVTHPQNISIHRKKDEIGVLLQVQVDAQDMGIVIGRSGIMAQSIKTIMRAVGKSVDTNVRIQFLEPDGSLKYASQPDENSATPSTDLDAEKTLDTDIDEFVIQS